MSASRSRSAGDTRSPTAIPTLAVTVKGVSLAPSSLKGSLSAASRRSATRSGPAASERSSAITTNSSPPRRPSVSVARTTPSSLAATAFSSSSPAPWPSVSLMDLKLSRSTNSAATGVWSRRERASICSMRSRISVRLGSPVSGSWVARNASCSSAPWRSDSKDSHIRTSVTLRLRCSMAIACASTSGGRASATAISRTTSSAASHQRRQRLVTSFSGAARCAAS